MHDLRWTQNKTNSTKRVVYCNDIMRYICGVKNQREYSKRSKHNIHGTILSVKRTQQD